MIDNTNNKFCIQYTKPVIGTKYYALHRENSKEMRLLFILRLIYYQRESFYDFDSHKCINVYCESFKNISIELFADNYINSYKKTSSFYKKNLQNP